MDNHSGVARCHCCRKFLPSQLGPLLGLSYHYSIDFNILMQSRLMKNCDFCFWNSKFELSYSRLEFGLYFCFMSVLSCCLLSLCLLFNRLARGLVLCLVQFMVLIQASLIICFLLCGIPLEIILNLLCNAFSVLISGHLV